MLKSSLRFYALFLSAVGIFFLNGCAPAYIPNVINTPLLTNKGEVQASVNGGIAGFDPQFAYAITDDLGIMINGSFENRTSDSTDNYHKHRFGEIGLGYYGNPGGIIRWEAFAGYGIGSIRSHFEDSFFEEYSSANIQRVFLQPAVGLTTDVLDFGLASRFVMVNVYQRSVSRIAYFVEPAVTARLGFRYVKFSMQLGFSMPLDASAVDFNYQPLLFSIGLHLRIGKKKRWQ